MPRQSPEEDKMNFKTGFNKLLAWIIAAVETIAPSVGILPETRTLDWNLGDGTVIYWVETDNSKIENEDLKDQIELFACEMAEFTKDKSAMGIVYGDAEKAGDKDIVLILDSKLGIAEEGYQILTESGQLHVSASDADGLFYGCRYVIKALRCGDSGKLPLNDVSSAPDYPERAFFLDCGRKYYSPDWIKDMIREISWSNMNAIYIHFSEEMGFRLESKTYPWLAGGDNTLCIGGASCGVADDNDKYITQDEMREIAEVAKLYHVEIIPSLDSPGHMNYAVKKYNQQYDTDIGNYYHYNGTTAIVQGSGTEEAQKSYSRGIDISNEEAVTFAKNLYGEYAAFFKELGCTKFDIGGDELLGWGASIDASVSKWKQLDHWKTYAQNRSGNSNAVAYDAFMYYMNDIYDLVKGYGYTSIRMWNDDALRSADTGWKEVVKLNSEIEIQYWTPTANNSKNNVLTYLNAGYKVYNFLSSYNYYVLGDTNRGVKGYAGITSQRIYENWAPNVFTPYNETGSDTAIGNENVLGSALCVWCDKPSTESAETVKSNLLPLLRMNGLKAWDADANVAVAYDDIQTIVNAFEDVPNVSCVAVPDIYQFPDISELKALITESETLDTSIYTEESVAKYTAAIVAAKVVLDIDRPTSEQVSEAVSAVNTAKAGLVLDLDYTKLDASLDTFAKCDGETYTDETYRAYSLYVEKAKTIRSDVTVDQASVDAAAAKLDELYNDLILRSDVAEGDDWFLSFASQSKYAYVGKMFVTTVYVRGDTDTCKFLMYDEDGDRVDFVRIAWSGSTSSSGKYGAQIRIAAEVSGEHIYTVYAVNKDGKRSPDSLSLTLTVK